MMFEFSEGQSVALVTSTGLKFSLLLGKFWRYWTCRLVVASGEYFDHEELNDGKENHEEAKQKQDIQAIY